jgi:hypothetical protein
VRGRAIAKDTLALDDGTVLRGRENLGRRTLTYGNNKVLPAEWRTARKSRQCRGCGRRTCVRAPDGWPCCGESCRQTAKRIEAETAAYCAEHYPNIETKEEP